jgi:hypothetical protein
MDYAKDLTAATQEAALLGDMKILSLIKAILSFLLQKQNMNQHHDQTQI